MAYFLLFPVFLFFLFISYPLSRLASKRLGWLVVFIYASVFALAYKLGTDWIGYYISYSGDGNKSFEPGYQTLESIFQSIGTGYWFFSFLIKLLYAV